MAQREPATRVMAIRMIRRRLFKIASALSLLLCAVALVAWVRSYRAWDMLSVDYPGHRAGVSSSRGSVLLELNGRSQENWQLRRISFQPADDLYDYLFGYMAPDYHGHGALGFYVFWATFGRGLLLPHWFIAVTSTILPVLWMRRRRRHEFTPGHCKACNYNLTANTSGVCPECGAAIARDDKIIA